METGFTQCFCLRNFIAFIAFLAHFSYAIDCVACVACVAFGWKPGLRRGLGWPRPSIKHRGPGPVTFKYILQEEWLSPTERASFSAISLRHIMASRGPWVRPWDNRGKCHMDEKRIQCLSNAHSMYDVPIYLQPFSCNSTRKFKSSPF